MEEKIIITIIAGFFGLIPILIQWGSNRSKVKSKEHHLTKITSQLSILERMAEFSQKYGDSENKSFSGNLQQELNRLYFQYISLQSVEDEKQEPSRELSVFRRALLLYKPSSFGAWVSHTLFYMFAWISLALLYSDISEGVEDLGIAIFLNVVIFGIPLLIFQRTASYLRKKTENASVD
jgi:hypothetical protein